MVILPRNNVSRTLSFRRALANVGLGRLEQISKDVQTPIVQSFGTVGEESSKLVDIASSMYEKRREYAPQIIASSIVSTGFIFTMRRGRVGGILGASVAGAAAYGVVYDKISVIGILDSVFPKDS